MLVDNHNRKYIFGWIKLPETCDRNEGVNLLSKLMSASPVTVWNTRVSETLYVWQMNKVKDCMAVRSNIQILINGIGVFLGIAFWNL